jgi:hypothetical protein
VGRATHLLDAQAGDGPGDDELLDLAGVLEDRVDHIRAICVVRVLPPSASEQV